MYALASCMRNEGPFLLEWVAYHRAIGFERIYVVTNDCTDGTDRMLDRLEALGAVTHLRNEIGEDEGPQEAGMRLVLARPEMSEIAWLLHIDADEFLHVTAGEGRVEDLVAVAGKGDNIALMWRPFGDSGQCWWRGGSVLRTFVRTQGRPRPQNAGHKSMFRPGSYMRAIDHMPKEPIPGAGATYIATGRRVRTAAPSHPTQSRYRLPDDALTWETACIHHYAVRSRDIFLMKNDRGDGMGRASGKYHLGSKFYRRHNRNEVEDTRILARLGPADALLERFLADPELRALDRAALAAFQERRDAVLTPERIAEWTFAPTPEPAPQGVADRDRAAVTRNTGTRVPAGGDPL